MKLSCCAVHQFYRETAEITDDMKSDSAADSKSTSPGSSGTDEVTIVADINDVDMKTEEGLLLMHLHFALFLEIPYCLSLCCLFNR